MKKIFCLFVLAIIALVGTVTSAASIGPEYSLNIRTESDGSKTLIGSSLSNTPFYGYVTDVPGVWHDETFFYFPQVDGDILEFNGLINNSITMYKDGKAYEAKTMNVWLLNDLTPDFDYAQGQFLGTLFSEHAGASYASIQFSNPGESFWIGLSDPVTIGMEGAGSQLFCPSGSVAPVPIPPSCILFGTGLLGILGFRRRVYIQ